MGGKQEKSENKNVMSSHSGIIMEDTIAVQEGTRHPDSKWVWNEC